VLEVNPERFTRQALPISQIYGKRNIFGLDWDPYVADKFELLPSPELTELKLPEKPAVEAAPPKENFIDPLNISINGIITSSNEEDNACIIAESSGDEKMYRVGDTVQDGVILNITLTSVSLIRPNGQIETFRIGEVEQPGAQNQANSAVTKLEDRKFSVDPVQFARQVNSLGQMIEELGIVPSYKDNLCCGLMVTKLAPEGIGKTLGFEEGDLIVSVSDTKLFTSQDRIGAYDKILKLTYGDSFSVELERGAEKVTLTYKLERYKSTPKTLAQALSDNGNNSPNNTAKANDNPATTPEKNMSIFTKPAEDRERYTSNINTIRKRLLENAGKQRISHQR
jgi:type II secretory pathway component PulC